MIMTGQCACGQKLEFEAEEIAESVCPSCNSPLASQFARRSENKLPKPDLNPSNIPPFPAITSERPSEPLGLPGRTLQAVRQESCYKTLRGLIESVIGFGVVICGLIIVIPIITLLVTPSTQFLFGAVITTAVGILAIVILVAIKQALLLAIDGVDVLIADRADRSQVFREISPGKVETPTTGK